MSNLNQTCSKYRYEENGMTVTKVNNETGESYSWSRNTKAKPEKKRTKNGITVEKLVAAGHRVRIRHFRRAYYLAQSIKQIAQPVIVPSTFRHDPMYHLLPKGGYTHITVQSPDDKYICLSSMCNENDPFCYNTGVVNALDRLTKDDLQRLGF